MARNKIALIGAGNIGGTLADLFQWACRTEAVSIGFYYDKRNPLSALAWICLCSNYDQTGKIAVSDKRFCSVYNELVALAHRGCADVL
mgnify:CR=1 FL=1